MLTYCTYCFVDIVSECLLELHSAGVAFPVGKIYRRGRNRDAYSDPMFVFFVCVCFVLVFVILLFYVFVLVYVSSVQSCGKVSGKICRRRRGRDRDAYGDPMLSLPQMSLLLMARNLH